MKLYMKQIQNVAEYRDEEVVYSSPTDLFMLCIAKHWHDNDHAGGIGKTAQTNLEPGYMRRALQRTLLQ